MPKQSRESHSTRKVMARLNREGWIMRNGKGDHINFFKPDVPALITIDTGKKEVLPSIYQKIAKLAGWR
ncbi:type II toxin-antitoxin system HicA family toxin [uncultured Adlercreutzia sp.]|uniref:type II toxin-antitoxin system HicA family toxin n=2 Tax=uncultured Adlercreutzia sp. TaxID=875803 RepID=UPI0025D316B2|nr:type II toxin-antitoxin system HicA family toxin [uncultured Adlercreutzia sp.]